ncbi:MAG: ABC transporter substrate-binding protein [Chitinophagales bacterium]
MPVVKPDVQDPVKDTVVIPPIVIKDPVKVDTVKEVIVKKDFKIAVMLPFGVDNYDLTPYDLQQVDFSRASAMSIEFFQGFQLAINSVKTSEINANIYVFDTKNDENVVKRTFNTAPFPKVDLIVGPVYNKNLRIAADYAEKHKIPLISPLSSSSSITKNNPYYYTANGTTDAHREAMMNHIQQFYPNDTLIIIHNSTSTEREVINSIKKINSKFDKGSSIFIQEIPVTIDDQLKTIKSQFDSLSTHLVFIPSNNEMFTTYVLSQLAQIKTYYPSIVFGMPNWNKFNNINYDYFEWLKVHLTESYWVNEHNIDVANFEQSFQAYYHMKPSEYAFQGYDLANYVLAYIAKNKDKLNKNKERFFTIDESDRGLQTKFKFIPRKNESGLDIDYWDNSYIHIVKFENYRYNKVD